MSKSNNVSYSNEHDEEEDRLSSLPNNLLITILSLLPIDNAAATSVLSRRWEHLWTNITHVSFPLSLTSEKTLIYFTTTVDHIISQLSSPKIETFNLDFRVPEDEYTLVRSSCTVPWIHEICSRYIRR